MAKVTKNEIAIRPVGTIYEEDDAVVLRLEMPGVGKDGIDINIEGDALTIGGHREEPQTGTYLVRERRSSDYRATYALDERVNRDKVDAKMEQGILTVKLQLKDEVKPRKIKVKTT